MNTSRAYQEYVSSIPKKMTNEEAQAILQELGAKTDSKNPKKDLRELADWERLIQLRKDAPLRACSPPPLCPPADAASLLLVPSSYLVHVLLRTIPHGQVRGALHSRVAPAAEIAGLRVFMMPPLRREGLVHGFAAPC